MLTNTFRHIPGIGAKTERQLWSSGLLSWDAAGGADLPLPARRAQALRSSVAESAARLADVDPDYFCGRLPANQHWRVFPEFQHRVAYLDIETTGLGGPGDYITTIAVYDGRSAHTYVRGDNLDEFPEDGGIVSVVAEGITALVFEYLSDEQWLRDWSAFEPAPPQAVRVMVSATDVKSASRSGSRDTTVLTTVVSIGAWSLSGSSESNSQGGPGR